jgi:hypothetical protein
LTANEFSALLLLVSYAAGLLGALTGLGGGIILTPILVLFFHVNIYYAMGASLVSVLATSSGTAAAYLKEGYTNLRIGMFLEVASVAGVFLGVYLIKILPVSMIAMVFGGVLLLSSVLSLMKKEETSSQPPHRLAILLHLNGEYPTETGGYQKYSVQQVPAAFGLFAIAGALSGLLGIGSGAIKVLAMDQAMRLPYKVSTTTSNFIMGITAAVGAGVYFSRGYICPPIVFPVALGVVFGALTGTKILIHTHHKILRVIFSVFVFLLAVQMIYKGVVGGV